MKRLLALPTLGLFLIMTGYQEYGCTDVFADNYSETAERHDGTCVYGIDLIFYFNEARATYYDDAVAYSPMHVVINGTDVGNTNWFYTYETEPECGQVGGTVNCKIELTSKIENVEVEIVDELGNSFGTETISMALSDGDCQALFCACKSSIHPNDALNIHLIYQITQVIRLKRRCFA